MKNIQFWIETLLPHAPRPDQVSHLRDDFPCLRLVRDFKGELLLQAQFPSLFSIAICVHINCQEGDKREDIPHYHNYFEMVYVVQGCCRQCMNQADHVDITPGYLLIMNPQTRHTLRNLTADTITFNFLLEPDFVEKTLLQLMRNEGDLMRFFFRSIYGQKMDNNYLIVSLNERAINYLDNCIDEFCRRDPIYEQMMQFNLLAAFGEIAREFHRDTQGKLSGLSGDQLSDILSYIYINYATATLSSTAHYFNYSEGHLSRFIKAQTGKTFSELVAQTRCNVARNYLENTSLTVETVSELVGYASVSGFFKNFKKQFEMSPKEYRDHCKKDEAFEQA